MTIKNHVVFILLPFHFFYKSYRQQIYRVRVVIVRKNNIKYNKKYNIEK